MLLGSSSLWADCTASNAIASQRVLDYSTWDMVTYYYCSTEDALDAISESLATSNCEVTFYQGAQITIPALVTKTTKKLTVNSATNSSQDSILIVNDFYGELTIKNFNQAARIDNNKKITVTSQDKSNLFVKNSATGTVNLNNAAAYNDTRIINNEGVINITSGIYNTGVSITNNGGTINISGETVNCRFSENVSFINNEGTISITGGYFAIPLYDQIRGFIAEGYAAYRTTNQYGEWYAIRSLGNNVATVNGIPYENLLTALEYSSEEYPATLITNVSVDFSDYLLHTRNDYLDMNGFNIQATGTIELLEASLTIKNSIPSEGGVISASSANQGSLIALVGAAWDKEESSVLSIGEGVTIKNTTNANYGVSIFGTGDDHNAYGVKVNIAGKVLTENGTALCINGMVQTTDGHVPQINIADGAVLGNAGEGCSQACIYAAGYGIWNIGAATLKANTPIYAKSGTININGATIEACGEYAEPVANSNGFNPTGDAILIDSHSSYAGNVILSVSGNATVTSANGYAIQEALTKMDETKAIGLITDNGSFAGAKGSVKLSDEFAQALADGSTAGGNWTLNAVTGGKYTSKPAVVADGYEVVEVSGELPFLYGVVEKTATSYTTKYFDDKAEYLNFTVEHGNEYVVRTGHTVNIGTLTIGDDASYPARVRIQPKGTLVVGNVIINNNKGAESLIVESDVTGYGMLLFNSNTVTNPFGTVEMYSHARILNAENGQYLFQHFGLPVYSEGAYITKNVPAAYSAWDIKKGWGYVSSDVVLSNGPWTGSNETPNSLYAGSMFSFSGVLVGNSDAEYNISSSEYGYKCFANSYSAPMSMTELMDQYNNPAVTDGTVWVFKASDYEKRGKEFVQWVYADAAEENAAIDPLQAFFVLHQSSTDDNFTVNYKNAVYDFNQGLNGDIKGAEAVTIDNKGKITITDGNSTATLNLYESQDLSDDFDMNYDGYQMETGNIQIYVSLGGKKWSSFGSNSFDGKEITIVSKEATQITMSFSKLGGKAFKLTDMASGAEVEVGSDKTYTFTVEPNATAVRFKLGEGEVSANEADANDAVNIWSNNGNIFVANNIAEADIEIINLSGVKVVSAKASGEAVQAVSISNLASGVYVVRVGNTAAKIVK